MQEVRFDKSKRNWTKERKAFWLSRDGIELVAGLRREGETVDEIALKHMGVSFSTLNRWCNESPDLNRALRTTQDAVNAMVESSLLKRALGYTAEEEVWELQDGRMVRTKIVKKHVPGDTKAMLAWLYSRRGDRWRSQQEPLDSTQEDIIDVKNVLVEIEKAAGDEDQADD